MFKKTTRKALTSNPGIKSNMLHATPNNSNRINRVFSKVLTTEYLFPLLSANLISKSNQQSYGNRAHKYTPYRYTS